MRSVMQHDFSRVPRCEIPRSVFNRSCGHKTTFGPDYLYPFYVDEVLPGDTFNVNATFLLRFNDLLRPFMDNLFFETFYFYVPYRLVWEHWENFCGAQKNPGDPTDYLVPQLTIPTASSLSSNLSYIWTYMGVPVFAGNNQTTNNIKINSLNLRAYNLIWAEWFRDENLLQQYYFDNRDVNQMVQTGDTEPSLIDGSTSVAPYERYRLLPVCKHHDYFTSCLPWPQKGPAVMLPLGSNVPVVGDGKTIALAAANSSGAVKYFNLMFNKDNDVSGGYLTLAQTGNGDLGKSAGSAASHYPNTGDGLGDTQTIGFSPSNTGLMADLSQATAATINQLREAFAVQRLYEKDARGGTRYTELLQSQFGVTNPDLRLQRPQYLGGSSQRFNVTQVPQTSAATEQSPQGNLAAYSLTGANSGFTQSFGEFGVVIGLMCVRADLNYQQGLDKMWTRRTRLDYYWPSLAHLGEQAVLNKEIYVQGTSADDDVFGYQERYAEYRYKPSLITGLLNSTASQSLDVWHLAQKFNNLPRLNGSFITSKTPISRVTATASDHPFLFDSYINIKAARPMPVYGVPGLMDHF